MAEHEHQGAHRGDHGGGVEQMPYEAVLTPQRDSSSANTAR